MKHSKRKMVYVFYCLFTLSLLPETGAAKSLYLCSEHHTSQFDAWNINPNGTVIKQATYSLQHATDPAGIAIDEDSQTIFITSEFSGGVEMVDPVTLTYLGVSSGPSDLAGIAVDDSADIVYTVERWSDDLYIYKWDPINLTMTELAKVDLPNCQGAFGISLDEGRKELWVADTAAGIVRAYDVTAQPNIIEIPAMNFQPSHIPVDVAVDRQRNYVYTVSIAGGVAWVPGGVGSHLLNKYDVATKTQTTVDMGHGGVGVAVDEVTGYVYVTGGGDTGDNLTIWDCSTVPFKKIQDTGQIGNPAGICIANVSYNPLNLAKNDVVVGKGVYIGQTFAYEITCDNKENIFDVTNVTMVDTLPVELDYVSSSIDGVPQPGSVYNSGTHTVTWDIGAIPAGGKGPLVELVVKVNNKAVPGSTIYNYCTIDSDQTPPTTVIGGDPDDPTGAPGSYIIPNRPPVADAGPDQTVEQESYDGAEVTLDGSGSTDPDSTPGTNDDIVSFDWYEGSTLLGSGEIIKHTFPLGTHVVTLVVTDSAGVTDDDEVTIKVVPKPMKWFLIEKAEITWASNTFIISGNFELPKGYQRADLDRSAMLSIQIAGTEGKDKIAFMDLGQAWSYSESGFNNGLGQGIDISKFDISWSNSKGSFYIKGELFLTGIGPDTVPREAMVALELGGKPPVVGKAVVGFERQGNVWYYGANPTSVKPAADDTAGGQLVSDAEPPTDSVGDGSVSESTDDWDAWLDELFYFEYLAPSEDLWLDEPLYFEDIGMQDFWFDEQPDSQNTDYPEDLLLDVLLNEDPAMLDDPWLNNLFRLWP